MLELRIDIANCKGIIEKITLFGKEIYLWAGDVVCSTRFSMVFGGVLIYQAEA